MIINKSKEKKIARYLTIISSAIFIISCLITRFYGGDWYIACAYLCNIIPGCVWIITNIINYIHLHKIEQKPRLYEDDIRDVLIEVFKPSISSYIPITLLLALSAIILTSRAEINHAFFIMIIECIMLMTGMSIWHMTNNLKAILRSRHINQNRVPKTAIDKTRPGIIIYFEDGPLDFETPSDIIKLDASMGFSYCEGVLENARIASKGNRSKYFIIYTNYLAALNPLFTWNEESKMHQVLIKLSSGEWRLIQDLTQRELRPAHNIEKMYIAGEFRLQGE